MIKAVIFDLDGVLVHTDCFHYIAWKKLADELEIPFDEERNRSLRGLSRIDSLREILKSSDKKYSKEQEKLFAKIKNATYKSLIKQMTPSDVDQDVLSALDVLNNCGIRLAVGSSSQNAMTILSMTELCKYFDAVVDGTMIAHAKPDPEVFLKAAELLKVTPNEAIVVEDAHSGIKAAHAGGFTSLAVGDAVSCEIADYALSCFSDLPKIVSRLTSLSL